MNRTIEERCEEKMIQKSEGERERDGEKSKDMKFDGFVLVFYLFSNHTFIK